MKKILIILTLFISSCLDSPNSVKSDMDNGNSTPYPITGDKVMYIRVRFTGSAYTEGKYAYKHSYNGANYYVSDAIFQEYNTRNTYTFKAKSGMQGYVNDRKTGFTSDNGKKFDIPFYIGDEVLKAKYKSSSSTALFKVTAAVGNLVGSSIATIWRLNGIEFRVPLSGFDENNHDNVALFTMELYEEPELNEFNYRELKYRVKFDGFQAK